MRVTNTWRKTIMRYPSVGVMTLNWNGKDDTIECVESLQGLTYPNYEIIVIDNGSTDGSVSAFRERFPGITIIENGRNLGYAEGFNAGMQYAAEKGFDYFLILNNDTVIDPNALHELVKVAETDSSIGFVSGKVYLYDEPNRLQIAGRLNHPILLVGDAVGSGELDHGQYDEMREYDFLDDIYWLVRREAFEKTGGYDPNFFLYYEEADWCVRARKAGYGLVYAPRAKLWHKDMGSQGGKIGPTFVYNYTRNEILFIWRNAPKNVFSQYARQLFGSAPRRLARYVKHRQFSLLAAYLRALASGILWVLRRSLA
jgi:GT2 family glycosyltransferase